jgi:hypothetical protein
MREPTDDRSIGELFAELPRETAALVRKEVELATTELTWKAKEAGGHGQPDAHSRKLRSCALLSVGWLLGLDSNQQPSG